MKFPLDDKRSPVSARQRRITQAGHWLALVGLSLAAVALLEWIRLPAAMLLGPMIAGIVVATRGTQVAVPRGAFVAAQAVIGCMIAGSISAEFFHSLGGQGPLFCAVVMAAILMSAFLGWMLTRWQVLPGTTAVWGMTPGGASAMVVMAQANGADIQLVAFMQYARVIVVALAASMVARYWADVPATGLAQVALAPAAWFPPADWSAWGIILLVAAVGATIGMRLRVPSGALLGPLALGALLHATWGVSMTMPEWFLALNYAALGWYVGLGFTRQSLRHAASALPQILLSTCALVLFCAGLAWMLARYAGIEPLTAYLASSPGGLDSVAIIAATAHVDVAFVITLQTVRLVLVILLGPAISGFVARRALPGGRA